MTTIFDKPTRCSSCDKEIRGSDVMGDIRAPHCLSCWLDPRTHISSQKEDEAPDLGYATKYAKGKIGELKPCPRCQDGEGGDCCRRCQGTGELIAVLCDQCEGSWEIEHDCDCSLCDIYEEDCSCDQGVVWAPVPAREIADANYRTAFVR